MHMFRILALLVGLTLAAFTFAQAADLVWYDADRQALAVDPYADGFGGTIDIDFNADHLAAGTIRQSLWSRADGYVTHCGLFNTTLDPWGSLTTYGWADRLGTLQPVYDFSEYLTNLYTGAPSVDGFHYAAPEWDVAAEKTVIYVRPVVGAAAVPVQAGDLEHTYLRINHGDWTSYAELGLPVPERDPVRVGVTISPRTLNGKSSGKWVTAQIEVPEPYAVADLDLDTVTLSVGAEITVNGTPVESVQVASEIARTGNGSNKLLAKFSREQLMRLLPPGESTVYARGELYDGTPITGEATLHLVR